MLTSCRQTEAERRAKPMRYGFSLILIVVLRQRRRDANEYLGAVERYSCRNASMGWIIAAFNAGISPNITPTVAENPMAIDTTPNRNRNVDHVGIQRRA